MAVEPANLAATPQPASLTQNQSCPAVLYTGQETQLAIVPMDDDDFSDHETVINRQNHNMTRQINAVIKRIIHYPLTQGLTDVNNVFKTLANLWQHNAHLAVFINFVVSYCDPASLVSRAVTETVLEN